MKIVIALAVCLMVSQVSADCPLFTCGTPTQPGGDAAPICGGPDPKNKDNSFAKENCGNSYSDP